jgi:hypothetical protein
VTRPSNPSLQLPPRPVTALAAGSRPAWHQRWRGVGEAKKQAGRSGPADELNVLQQGRVVYVHGRGQQPGKSTGCGADRDSLEAELTEETMTWRKTTFLAICIFLAVTSSWFVVVHAKSRPHFDVRVVQSSRHFKVLLVPPGGRTLLSGPDDPHEVNSKPFPCAGWDHVSAQARILNRKTGHIRVVESESIHFGILPGDSATSARPAGIKVYLGAAHRVAGTEARAHAVFDLFENEELIGFSVYLSR